MGHQPRSVLEPNTIIWRFKSRRTETVYFSLFSQDRDIAWPGDNRVYLIDYNEEVTVTTRGEPGETICYGAWTADYKHIWGVGPNGNNACRNCCYKGGGFETSVIEFGY